MEDDFIGMKLLTDSISILEISFVTICSFKIDINSLTVTWQKAPYRITR